MHKTMMTRLLLSAALFALPWTTLAQPNQNRGAMTLNEAGDVLRFVAEEDDEPTAVFESGASSTDILGFDDSFQGETVDGFGNLADLNDLGVAVMKVVTTETVDVRGTEESAESQYLVTSDNGGSPSTIAVARRGGAGSTAFGGDVLCEIGPMPENNNSGQIAWFGHLVPSAGPSFVCTGGESWGSSPDSTSWNASYYNNINSSWGEDYFIADQDETTLNENDAVTGTYVLAQGVVKSALFRYSPGGGHSILLEGNILGNADTLTVSNPDFVDSTIVYKVHEVDYIRDGSQRMNAGGTIVAHVTLFDGPAESGEFTGCTANVDTVQDNPFDDPDGSAPWIEYDSISCPGFRGSPDIEDALVVFNGSTPTVIAATGPDSIYDEVEDEAAIINNSGQVLFRADRNDPARGGTFSTIELYTPGNGTTVIASEGDPVPTPNSDCVFSDFSPHYDLANDGSFAFQAELTDCAAIRGDGDDGETAIFHYSGGSITELFRTEDLAEPGVTVPSTWMGNPIDDLSSVAISPTSGLVQFYVESVDPAAAPSDCQEDRGNFSTDFGGGEWTALVSWTELNGLETVMAEGDPIGAGDAYIFRIYAMGPKLRAQANSSAEMVALVDINRDGMDCDVDQDDENIDETQVVLIGRGTPPIGSILEIPVAGPLGLGLFAAALLMLSMMWVRHRAPGV